MIAFPWSRRSERLGHPTIRRRILAFVWRHLSSLVLLLLVSAFVVVVIAPYMVVNVPSGRVGVLWKRFGGGTVLDQRSLRNEGLHVIFPWDRLFLYDLRIQSKSETYDAISSDGVNLSATVYIRFRMRREFIPQIHQSIGPDYVSLLGPEVASRMREVISQYTAEQVYSTQRQNIQEEIKNRVIVKLGEQVLEHEGAGSYRIPFRDVGILYDTLLHEIKLPPAVVSAINRKAEQYYVAQEYAYRVDRERRESERKRVEAEGIRDFQQIVSQGISDSYLRLRGIEATLELARSNNSKVVIIGGRDGLPIILGNVDAAVRPPQLGSDPPSAPAGTAPAPAGPPTPAEKPDPDKRSELPLSNIERFFAKLWGREPAEPMSRPSPPEAPRDEAAQP